MVVGLDAGPTTLDPRFGTDAAASQIGELVFDALTRVDDGGRRLPQLAESWEMAEAQTYVFRLRDGFRFGSGEPVTAADVKATYDSVLDPRTQSPKREEIGPIEAVEVLDRLTVRFRLRSPFAPFLSQTGLGILPAAAIAASPDRPISLPPGSGPFLIKEFTPDDKLVLSRNADYPLKSPRLAGIVFMVVPDAVSRLLQLKRGALDLVQNGIDPDMLDWLKRQPHVKVLTAPGTTVQYLGLNHRDPKLADVRVRQAVAYATDRDAIVNTILKGTGQVADSLLSPSNWAYSAAVPEYAYDPQRAKLLLDDAGFTDPDGDGPLPRFRLSYKTSTIELRQRIAEVLQEQLAGVGIGLDVRSYEWATFYSDIRRGNFQLYSLAWVGIQDPDIYYLTSHSSQVPPRGLNRGWFSDEAIDRWTDAARSSLDQDERRQLYAAVQQRSAQVLPVVPLWWTTNVVAVNRRLHGFVVRPNASYQSLKEAWVEEKGRT